MIKYDAGHLGLLFVVRWRGSVFPKAMLWAIPNAILALLLHQYARQEQAEGNTMSMNGVNAVWTGYTSVLGFLMVFRNNQAYTRFWEGATLINQVRGEWFNAVSTLFAFCNHAKEFEEKVETFQHTLVRLASMLYCSALQQVCDLEDDTLEIIENEGLDTESLGFMQDSNDRCEILLQWVQRLIVENEECKTIKIAPPLLTRAFQELSRGIVNLNNARKIKDIPFPFPYAQMITCMLIVHWIATPLLASQIIESQAAAVVVCFFVTFAFWCLIYIALEIDQPFGEDDNDLPLREMQRDFNQSLLNLMHPLAQKVPSYQAPPLTSEAAERPAWQPMLSRSEATLCRSQVARLRTRSKFPKERPRSTRSSTGSVHLDGWITRICHQQRLAREYIRRRGRPLPEEPLEEPPSEFGGKQYAQHGKDMGQSTIMAVDVGVPERQRPPSAASGEGLGPASGLMTRDGADPRPIAYSGAHPPGVVANPLQESAAGCPLRAVVQGPLQLPPLAQEPACSSLAPAEPVRADGASGPPQAMLPGASAQSRAVPVGRPGRALPEHADWCVLAGNAFVPTTRRGAEDRDVEDRAQGGTGGPQQECQENPRERAASEGAPAAGKLPGVPDVEAANGVPADLTGVESTPSIEVMPADWARRADTPSQQPAPPKAVSIAEAPPGCSRGASGTSAQGRGGLIKGVAAEATAEAAQAAAAAGAPPAGATCVGQSDFSDPAPASSTLPQNSGEANFGAAKDPVNGEK